MMNSDTNTHRKNNILLTKSPQNILLSQNTNNVPRTPVSAGSTITVENYVNSSTSSTSKSSDKNNNSNSNNSNNNNSSNNSKPVRNNSFNAFMNSFTTTGSTSTSTGGGVVTSPSLFSITSTPQKQIQKQQQQQQQDLISLQQSSQSTTIITTPHQHQSLSIINSITTPTTNGSSNGRNHGGNSGSNNNGNNSGGKHSSNSGNNNNSGGRQLIRTLSFKASPTRKITNLYRSTSAGNNATTIPQGIVVTDWHNDILKSFESNNWDIVYNTIQYHTSRLHSLSYNSNSNTESPTKDQGVKRASSFWSRLAGTSIGNKNNTNTDEQQLDRTGLLQLDKEQRTPLQLLLSLQQQQQQQQYQEEYRHQDQYQMSSMTSNSNVQVPIDIIIQIIDLEPKACTIGNNKGRIPLHLAIIYQHDISIINKLVKVYPNAITIQDNKKQTPFEYAIDTIIRTTELYKAPVTFWMPVFHTRNNKNNKNNIVQEESWQQKQIHKWSIVQYMLSSYAEATTTTTESTTTTHVAQTAKALLLSVGSKKRPIILDALINAASPTVISLLINQSSSSLSTSSSTSSSCSTSTKMSSAFAGTAVYTCISRHYPLHVLQSLVVQCCPNDVYKVQDETGMGLISAQYISGCYYQLRSTQIQEWKLSIQFYNSFVDCITRTGKIITNNPALHDWWLKIEFLISYCCCCCLYSSSNTSNSTVYNQIPSQYLLRAALINSDVPPNVIRMLLKLYPQSIHLSWYPPTTMTTMTTTTMNDKKRNQNNVKESQQQTSIEIVPTPIDDSTPIGTSNDDDDDDYNDSHKGGALPLHLVSMTKEYMLRFYERIQIDNDATSGSISASTSAIEKTTFDIILNENQSAIWKRYDNRLPIHYAIASGRLLSTLQSLIELDINLLLVRDPKTLLYPFLHVASYNDQNDKDSYRWSCRARNQYSNADWKNLSDRNKAMAVLKIAEQDSISRIETCYTLLRRNPNVLELCFNSHSNNNTENNSGRSSSSNSCSSSSKLKKVQCRDSTGMGAVASHYVSWCYNTTKYNNVTKWTRNVYNQQLLQEELQKYQNGIVLPTLELTFQTYWTQQLFWIKQCCPPEVKITFGNDNNETPLVITFPQTTSYDDENEYRIVHAAVTNSDTPPEIVQLLTTIYPHACSSPVLDSTSLLPLHIASHVQSYTHRIFETSNCTDIQGGALGVVLRSYPTAARVSWNGLLPLHIAINSGKSEAEIKLLINAAPISLTVRDPIQKLYPFQSMAIPRLYTPEQRSQFQYVTRNKYNEETWTNMTPQQQTKEFRLSQRHHQLTILSCIYTMVRSNPALLNKHLPTSEIASTGGCVNGGSHVSIMHNDPTIEVQGDSSISEVDDTEVSNSTNAMTHYLSKSKKELDFQLDGASSHSSLTPSFAFSDCESIKKPSPLVLLLSQHSRSFNKHHIDGTNDLSDCDASVFSSVDVMSALSSTHHTEKKSKKQRNGTHNHGSQMIHFDMFALDDNTSSSDDNEMETNHALTNELKIKEVSQGKVKRERATEVASGDDASIEKEEVFEESDNDSCSDDSTVVFEIRKKPRFYSKKDNNATPSGIKLTRKQGQGNSIPSVQDSIDKHSVHDDRNSNNNTHESASVGSRPNGSTTSSTSSYAPGHYIEANVDANAIADDESTLTWESYKPMQNDSTFQDQKQVNMSSETRSPTSTSATGSSKSATLLGTMNDVSHNSNDDDSLLVFKKEVATVSSISTDLHSSSKKSIDSKSSRSKNSIDSKSSRSRNKKLNKNSLLGSYNNSGAVSLDEHFENMNNQSLASVTRRTRDTHLVIPTEHGPIESTKSSTLGVTMGYPLDPIELSALNTTLEISDKFLPLSKSSSHRIFSEPEDTPSTNSVEDGKAFNASLDWSKTSNTLEGLIALNSIASESTRNSEQLVVSSIASSKASTLLSKTETCALVMNEKLMSIQAKEKVEVSCRDKTVLCSTNQMANNCRNASNDFKQSNDQERRNQEPPVQKYEIKFDKIAFRWIKTPINEDYEECTHTTKPFDVKRDADVVVDQQIQTSQKETRKVIFDKKTMSWQVQETLINDSKHDFIAQEIMEQQSQGKVASTRMLRESEHSTRSTELNGVKVLPPIPFLGERTSRHKSKRRNKALSSFILHMQDSKKIQKVVTSASVIIVPEPVIGKNNMFQVKEKITSDRGHHHQQHHHQQQQPQHMNSSMKKTTNQWSTMFTSQKRLLCLQCEVNSIEVLLLPCRHLCLCRHCCANYQPLQHKQQQQGTELTHCPICDEEVTDKMLIY